MDELFHASAPEKHTPEQWYEWYRQHRYQTALEPHDVTLESISSDSIILRMEIGDHARQPYGLLHGGISMLLAESAASIHACWGVDLRKRVPVGIEINGSHMSSAEEGTIQAVGTVLRRGITLVHHRVEIRSLEKDRLLSEVRVTNMLRSVRAK